MAEDSFDKSELLAAAQAIVVAHLGNNQVALADVPAFISSVLKTISDGVSKEEPEVLPKPAVSISRSNTPDKIICLECGLGFKSLKRHIQTHHGFSPEEYRARWGLPSSYPMVASNYAAQRSALAKAAGLGTRQKAESSVVSPIRKVAKAKASK